MSYCAEQKTQKLEKNRFCLHSRVLAWLVNRGFHKHTKLAILILLPILYFHIF